MKLKATTPKAPDTEREKEIAAIVGGATASPPAARQMPMPWRDPKKHPDVPRQANVRLPGALVEKLNLVSSLDSRQKQDIVAEALAPVLDARLRELGYQDDEL